MSSVVDSHHMRKCLLDYHRSGRSRREVTVLLQQQFGDKVPTSKWITKWWKRFDEENYDLEDQQRSGRPRVAKRRPVLRALENQPNSSLRVLKRKTGTSHETVRRILREAGKVPKKPKIVPAELTTAQKKQRVDTCETNLAHRKMRTLLNSLICQDEKYIYYSNPAHNPLWVDFDAPPPTRAKRNSHCKKVLLSFWFSRHGVVHYELLPENTTVTAQVLTAELHEVKRKAALLSKKLNFPCLLWDNARPHKSSTTRAVLETLGFKELPHPPYSPDISPCDYHIFRSLQHHCDGKRFNTRDDIKRELQRWIRSQPEEFWKRGIDSLPNRWRTVVDSRGEYIIDL